MAQIPLTYPFLFSTFPFIASEEELGGGSHRGCTPGQGCPLGRIPATHATSTKPSPPASFWRCSNTKVLEINYVGGELHCHPPTPPAWHLLPLPPCNSRSANEGRKLLVSIYCHHPRLPRPGRGRPIGKNSSLERKEAQGFLLKTKTSNASRKQM